MIRREKLFPENLCRHEWASFQGEHGHSLQEYSPSGAFLLKNETSCHKKSSELCSGCNGHSAGAGGCLLSYEVDFLVLASEDFIVNRHFVYECEFDKFCKVL